VSNSYHDPPYTTPGCRCPIQERLLCEINTIRDTVPDEKGIHLKTESSGLPALAHADGPAIHRLLPILLDNALKHIPGVLPSVADTGEGIPPDALPHIFERFYRCDPARAGGSGSGFGLGLSIAQAHGTRIAVESAPGAGARFTIALKVA